MIETVPQSVFHTEMPRAAFALLAPHHVRVALDNSLDCEHERRGFRGRAEFAPQTIHAAGRPVKIHDIVFSCIASNAPINSKREAKCGKPPLALPLVQNIVQKEAVDFMPAFAKLSSVIQYHASCAPFPEPHHIGSDQYPHR